MISPEQKYNYLKKLIASYRRVLIAFSGGCDSAFILKVARDVLGRDSVLAVTTHSESFPKKDIEDVNRFIKKYDIQHQWIKTQEIDNPNYYKNPTDRCYHCKTELYAWLKPIAQKNGFEIILNGTNINDLGDWRPGLRAAKENRILSPLVEAGFDKEGIRYFSKKLGLFTWDKPQAACLSSRIPYGQDVTEQKLEQVDQAEAVLRSHGFRIVRLRHYGKSAKIEVGPDELFRFSDEKLRQSVASQIESLGFEKVEIDSKGYRQGSLNKTILNQ